MRLLTVELIRWALFIVTPLLCLSLPWLTWGPIHVALKQPPTEIILANFLDLYLGLLARLACLTRRLLREFPLKTLTLGGLRLFSVLCNFILNSLEQLLLLSSRDILRSGGLDLLNLLMDNREWWLFLILILLVLAQVIV